MTKTQGKGKSSSVDLGDRYTMINHFAYWR